MNYSNPDCIIRQIAGAEIVYRGIWIALYNLLLRQFTYTSSLSHSFHEQRKELAYDSPRALFAEYMISLHCRTMIITCPQSLIGERFVVYITTYVSI